MVSISSATSSEEPPLLPGALSAQNTCGWRASPVAHVKLCVTAPLFLSHSTQTRQNLSLRLSSLQGPQHTTLTFLHSQGSAG